MTVCNLLTATVQMMLFVVVCVTSSRNGSEVAQVLDTDLYKNPKVYNKVKVLRPWYSVFASSYNLFIDRVIMLWFWKCISCIFIQVKAIEGVKVVSYCSPLYFANAEIFRHKVIKKVCWSYWISHSECAYCISTNLISDIIS